MKKTLAAFSVACALAGAAPARAAEPLDFLVGRWTGSGQGEPGQGSGEFSFTRELGGRVLVRRAHSTYPAANGRPAITHDDLLVVHSQGKLADYYDNEGHVIHYRVTPGDDGKSATFLSVDPPPSPLFRLTYAQRAGGTMSVRFEIAPGGKPEDLKVYLDGTVHRAP